MGLTIELAFLTDIWSSSDGGENWQEITSLAPWGESQNFHVVVLSNNNVLAMDGYHENIWLSRTSGNHWDKLPFSFPITLYSSASWLSLVSSFQAFVFLDNLLIAGISRESSNYGYSRSLWQSDNGGTNWESIQITPDDVIDRAQYQSVVLTNNDLLIMGGAIFLPNYYLTNDIWRSSDKGRSWQSIPVSNHWSIRNAFQSVVLPNNSILVMGGYDGALNLNDVWLSVNGGVNWKNISPSLSHWGGNSLFQAVVLPNGNVLVMGGVKNSNFPRNDIWRLELYNQNHYEY